MENNCSKDTFFVVLEASILKDKNLSYSAKILYACICFSSNNEKGYCFRSNKELMNLSCMSEKQFYRNIKKLLEDNYITSIIKNDVKFYIPTVNNIYLELEKKRKKRHEELKNSVEILDYDWLNDR